SVKGRYHGDSVFLDVTIFVDRTITLDEAHDICDKVERSLAAEGVYSSYVHPEPYEEESKADAAASALSSSTSFQYILLWRRPGYALHPLRRKAVSRCGRHCPF